MTPVLEAKKLCCGYGEAQVVTELDLYVNSGEIVALLGPNGAGKTTTLRCLSGEIRLQSGNLLWDGAPAQGPLHRRIRNGMGLVTEEKSVFMRLTTLENLKLGRIDPEEAFALFPELRNRAKVKAGQLSGGEQQMLTLARVLARKPRLLLADELSLGLAPLAVERLLAALRSAAADGVGVLLVEQHVSKVLEYANRAYVMNKGRIEMHGTSVELRQSLLQMEASYLGRTGTQPGSTQDVPSMNGGTPHVP